MMFYLFLDIYSFVECLSRDSESGDMEMDMLSANSQHFTDLCLDANDQTIPKTSDVIRCFMHIEEDGLCERVNNSSAYCEVNRQV